MAGSRQGMTRGMADKVSKEAESRRSRAGVYYADKRTACRFFNTPPIRGGYRRRTERRVSYGVHLSVRVCAPLADTLPRTVRRASGGSMFVVASLPVATTHDRRWLLGPRPAVWLLSAPTSPLSVTANPSRSPGGVLSRENSRKTVRTRRRSSQSPRVTFGLCVPAAHSTLYGRAGRWLEVPGTTQRAPRAQLHAWIRWKRRAHKNP